MAAVTCATAVARCEWPAICVRVSLRRGDYREPIPIRSRSDPIPARIQHFHADARRRVAGSSAAAAAHPPDWPGEWSARRSRRESAALCEH